MALVLGQTDKPAARLICADPDAWYRVDATVMGPEAYDDLRQALHDPHVVHAMCEDYRAGLGIDRADDDRDHAAGRRVSCPTLVIWASRDDMETLYGDPLAVWREWAKDPQGVRLESGHHMAEEVPDELAAAIRLFVAV